MIFDHSCTKIFLENHDFWWVFKNREKRDFWKKSWCRNGKNWGFRDFLKITKKLNFLVILGRRSRAQVKGFDDLNHSCAKILTRGYRTPDNALTWRVYRAIICPRCAAKAAPGRSGSRHFGTSPYGLPCREKFKIIIPRLAAPQAALARSARPIIPSCEAARDYWVNNHLTRSNSRFAKIFLKKNFKGTGV